MRQQSTAAPQRKHKAMPSDTKRGFSLPLRIILLVLAIVALLGAGLAGVNIAAISTYNQATQSLNNNLTEARSANPDLDKIAIQARQTDSQFKDVSKLSALLLPQTRQATAHNTSVSRTLTRTTHDKITKSKRVKAQQAQKNGSVAAGDGQDGAGGLDDKQRAQIEQMLKDNQPATGQDDGSSNTNKPGNDQQAKPW